MKKIMALLLIMIMLCSCGGKHKKDIYINNDFQFGVIRTCDSRNSTVLSLYDKDLRVIETKKIKYGGVRNTWSNPIVSDGHLMVNAQGLQGRKDLGLTMDFDIEKGKIRFVKNGLVGPSHCLWGKDYIYVCNNLNLKSTIVRLDKDGENPVEKKISVPIITAIFEWNDKLIVFGRKSGDKIESFLYILDTDLNILKQENITDTGCGIYNVCQFENNLYFNILSDTHGENIYKIGVLSLEDYKISTIEISELRAYTLKIDKHKLYISNSDHDEHPMLGVYDLQTEKFESYYLEQPAQKLEVKDGIVYTLYDGTIFEYHLKDGIATVENKANVDTSLEGGKFHYDSTFFLKK